MNLRLQDSIQYVKGVGPRRQALFEKLGVATVADALNFFPRSYEDRSRLVKINQLRLGDRATLRLRVAAAEAYESRNRRNMAKVLFEDDTGEIEAVWFNARYWKADAFTPGREFYVTGKVDFYKTLQIASPQCEPVDQEDTAHGFGPAILPEYPLTESMNQTVMRKVMRQVVDAAAGLVEEYLPADLLKTRRLLDIHDAYRNVHFPESSEMAAKARRRLIYSEFLLLQLGIALRRRGVRAEEKAIPFRVSDEVDQRIRRRFPFTLTAAQERVIAEIRADMESPKPMNRLLQGDVGSGKTAVALYALLAAVAGGAQAALMAPTEILAEQHYLTFARYLADSRV
ncbi:MAG TPA: DEAD/DEAH box helicase, partial [Candidatus Brocadiia bacterium]|nr:DEAD/DEAH box helicase [Candidatus Brocadiia bacterium]